MEKQKQPTMMTRERSLASTLFQQSGRVRMILLAPHVSPDGDTMRLSCLALRPALCKALGKEVTVLLSRTRCRNMHELSAGGGQRSASGKPERWRMPDAWSICAIGIDVADPAPLGQRASGELFGGCAAYRADRPSRHKSGL